MRWLGVVVLSLLWCLLSCKSQPDTYTTTVEVMALRQFGQTTRMTDIEVKYADCPGNARKVMRLGGDFGECGAKLKVGDKVSASVEHAYNAERGFYRNILVALGDCAVKIDPNDEANYDQVENCTELKASGMVVGVHCDRKRSDELVKACPWLFTR